MMTALWIALFGAAGSLLRYLVQGQVPRLAGSALPWGTLAVNVTGSFLVGFIAKYATGGAAMTPELRIGLLVGLCGGYTTFSTYSLETVLLIQEGAWGRAAAYAGMSVVLSVAATALGIQAGRLLQGL